MSDAKSNKPESVRGMEAVVKNASVMNRSVIAGIHFKEGEKIIISNEDYSAQEMRVVEVQRDGSDVHVHLHGGNVNMVVEMSWLQREYARGKIAKIDPATGNPIRHEEKLSDGTGN